jgi:hypothetical protein
MDYLNMASAPFHVVPPPPIDFDYSVGLEVHVCLCPLGVTYSMIIGTYIHKSSIELTTFATVNELNGGYRIISRINHRVICLV